MSDLKYSRILRAVASAPWAITPTRLTDIVDVLAAQASGAKLTADEIREYVGLVDVPTRVQLVTQAGVHAGETVAYALAAAGGRLSAGGAAVAVLGLRGIISHRIEQVQDISGPGGTSVEGLRSRLRDALASDQVGAVIIDVDSPGGSVDGVQELAEEIYGMRGDKPIVAVANTLAASAAYYLASQADEVVVTPSGAVGSIGVFSAHEDLSEKLSAEGRKVTLISAGEYKVEGNPFEPLTDEARAAIQSDVDDHYRAFVDAVARGRGVKSSVVRGGYGEGRTVNARASVAEGMADRIETLEQTIQRLQGKTGNRPASRRRGPQSVAEFEFYTPAA